MNHVIRSASARGNDVVGPLVMVMGVLAMVTAIVLVIALDSAWFLGLFLPALMGIGAGLFITRMAKRARLEITPAGFTWAGPSGPERSLRWEQVYRIVHPGQADRRIAAVAQLHDGSLVPIRAEWNSPTSPAVLLGMEDHTEALRTLVGAHQQWLAAHRRG